MKRSNERPRPVVNEPYVPAEVKLGQELESRGARACTLGPVVTHRGRRWLLGVELGADHEVNAHTPTLLGRIASGAARKVFNINPEVLLYNYSETAEDVAPTFAIVALPPLDSISLSPCINEASLDQAILEKMPEIRNIRRYTVD